MSQTSAPKRLGLFLITASWLAPVRWKDGSLSRPARGFSAHVHIDLFSWMPTRRAVPLSRTLVLLARGEDV